MRLHEILSEEQLDELNRRDFLKHMGWTAMAAGLTAGALDQGKRPDPEQAADQDDEDDEDDEEVA